MEESLCHLPYLISYYSWDLTPEFTLQPTNLSRSLRQRKVRGSRKARSRIEYWATKETYGSTAK